MKERWMTGPLGAHVPGFGEELARLGYAARPARRHLQLLSQLSSWLEVEELEPAGLSSTRVVDFLDARRAQGHSRLVTAVGVAPMLGYLRRLGVIPEPSRPTPVGPVEEFMAVPGPVRSPASAGTNRLLCEGCAPACEATDVLVALSLEGGSSPRTERRPPPGPEDAPVLEAVGWEATSTEQVLVRTGLTPSRLAVALTHLEADGWVRNLGGWWERAAP